MSGSINIPEAISTPLSRSGKTSPLKSTSVKKNAGLLGEIVIPGLEQEKYIICLGHLVPEGKACSENRVGLHMEASSQGLPLAKYGAISWSE